jgi:hypothetical protein
MVQKITVIENKLKIRYSGMVQNITVSETKLKIRNIYTEYHHI